MAQYLPSFVAAAPKTARYEFEVLYWKAQEHLFKVFEPNLVKQKISQQITSLSSDQLVESLTEQFTLDSSKITVKSSVLDLLKSGSLIDLINKMKQEGITVNSSQDVIQKCVLQVKSAGVVFKSPVEAQVEYLFSQVFPEAVKFAHHIIGMTLKTLGLDEIGQETPTRMDALAKYELYMTILGYPSLVFIGLTQFLALPYELAIAVTGAIVAATVLAIIGYIRYLKPCPDTVEGFNNLTFAALKGFLEPVYGRENEIYDILTKLKEGKGVIVAGEAKVGKHKLFEELARLVAAGNLPEEFAIFNHKKIFFENASSADSPDKIMARLNGYGREAIVVFYDSPQPAALGESPDAISLLSMLSPRTPEETIKKVRGLLPYCIGVTDSLDKESEEIPFVKIKSMTREQTQDVLTHFLETKRDVRIDEDIVEYLLAKIEEKNIQFLEPNFSRSVLEEALGKVFRDPSNKRETLISIRSQKSILQSKMRQSSAITQQNPEQMASSIASLEAEELRIVSQMQKQQKAIARMQKIQRLWNEKKEEMYAIASQVKEFSSRNQSSEKLQRKWIMLSTFVLPSLEKVMKKFEESPDLKDVVTKIDKVLIKKVLESKLLKAEKTIKSKEESDSSEKKIVAEAESGLVQV